MNYIKAVQTWGVKETFKKFFTLKQIKFGTLVGVDENGNKYFENLNEPYGQHRWVEPPYAVHGSSWDASNIAPAWHPWIHCATDKVPTSAAPQGETGVHIVDGVDTPVRHHINLDHRKPWRPNPTLHRERGHNVDHSSGKAGENDYYVQPGHVASPLFEEKGPKIESWGGLPTDDSASHVGEPKKEKSRWELFYEQRQRMNQQ